MYYELKMK